MRDLSERLARVLRAGLNEAYNNDVITQDEYFDALGYIGEHEHVRV